MKIIISKKAMYNWFVLVMATILLTTAFLSLLLTKESLQFNALGSRSGSILTATIAQDFKQLKLDEAANRGANKAIVNILAKNEPSSIYYYSYNQKLIEKLFIDEFVIHFDKEIKNVGLDYKINNKTINIKDGNVVFGFGKEKDIVINNNLAKFNLSYIPKFSYSFQKFNLNEYENMYNFMNKFLLKTISHCKQNNQNIKDEDLFQCVIANYSQIPLVYKTREIKPYFNENCFDKLDENYFAAYNSLSSKYNLEQHKLQYYTVCLIDENLLIQGYNKNNDFIVDSPIFIFFIDKSLDFSNIQNNANNILNTDNTFDINGNQNVNTNQNMINNNFNFANAFN